MKRTHDDRAPQRRRSREEGLALVEKWRKSGLSAAKFAKADRVGLHVLRYWIQTHRATTQPSASKSPDFVVVSAPASNIEPTAGGLGATSTKVNAEVFELRVNGMVVSVPLVAGHGAFIETVHAVLCEVGQ
jgi:transposase-like protein